MGVPVRAPVLPKAALYLGLVAAGLIGGGLVVGIAGGLVAVLWRPAGLVTSGVGLFAIAVAPVVAIGAIVVGYVSGRRYPNDRRGRTGLIIGFAVIGSIAVLGLVGIVTWQTIR
jgi:hypothetical protein